MTKLYRLYRDELYPVYSFEERDPLNTTDGRRVYNLNEQDVIRYEKAYTLFIKELARLDKIMDHTND